MRRSVESIQLVYISLCLKAFHALEIAPGYRKKAKVFRGNCVHYRRACKSLIRAGKICFVKHVKPDLGEFSEPLSCVCAQL